MFSSRKFPSVTLPMTLAFKLDLDSQVKPPCKYLSQSESVSSFPMAHQSIHSVP